MRKFEFTLQRVLDYRRMAEGWAKDAYLDARVRRLEAETVVQGIFRKRSEAMRSHPESVDQMLALENYLLRLDDDERTQHAVIAVLFQEEEQAKEKWIECRKESEVLQKLHDKAREEWAYESNRQEQNALDEWSVLRRKAA